MSTPEGKSFKVTGGANVDAVERILKDIEKFLPVFTILLLDIPFFFVKV